MAKSVARQMWQQLPPVVEHLPPSLLHPLPLPLPALSLLPQTHSSSSVVSDTAQNCPFQASIHQRGLVAICQRSAAMRSQAGFKRFPRLRSTPCPAPLSLSLCRRDANCCWRCVDVGFGNFLRDLWAARSALIYAKLFTN